MTGAAVPQTLDQVRTAVPFRRLRWVVPQAPGLEKQRVPQAHGPAHRKQHAVGRWPVAHRRQGAEVGMEGCNVGVTDLRERGVGKRREQMGTTAGRPLLHRPAQIRHAPRTYPGLRVRRDVGRIESAERRLECQAARERRTARPRVTAQAITGGSEIAALRDARGRRHRTRPSASRSTGCSTGRSAYAHAHSHAHAQQAENDSHAGAREAAA